MNFGSTAERTPPLPLSWDGALLVQALVSCMNVVRLQWARVALGSCKLTSCAHRQLHHVCPDQKVLPGGVLMLMADG